LLGKRKVRILFHEIQHGPKCIQRHGHRLIPSPHPKEHPVIHH